MNRTRSNPDFNRTHDDPLSFAHNERLIYSVARKAHARLLAGGLGIDFEDVYQDVVETYLKAKARFNPQFGAHFSTFFVTAFYNNFNRAAEKSFLANAHERSVQDMGDEERDFMDVLADDEGLPPDEALALKERAAYADSHLSELARVVMAAIVEPTPAMQKAFVAYQDAARMKREAGENVRAAKSLNVDFVIRYFATPHKLSEKKVKDLINRTKKELVEVTDAINRF